MSFNLDDYEPVQSRFARFIEWAEGRENFFAVVSEMLSAPGDDVCVIKTSIICDGMVVATGHAEEVRGQGNVNKTSHVENCETSSLGRCLANFPLCNFAGSDVSKRPSREEMGKVQRMGATVPGYGGKTIKNKFPNACVKCGARVETGEGLAQQNAQGKWDTFHSEGKCNTDEAPF